MLPGSMPGRSSRRIGAIRPPLSAWRANHIGLGIGVNRVMLKRFVSLVWT